MPDHPQGPLDTRPSGVPYTPTDPDEVAARRQTVVLGSRGTVAELNRLFRDAHPFEAGPYVSAEEFETDECELAELESLRGAAQEHRDTVLANRRILHSTPLVQIREVRFDRGDPFITAPDGTVAFHVTSSFGGGNLLWVWNRFTSQADVFPATELRTRYPQFERRHDSPVLQGQPGAGEPGNRRIYRPVGEDALPHHDSGDWDWFDDRRSQ